MACPTPLCYRLGMVKLQLSFLCLTSLVISCYRLGMVKLQRGYPLPDIPLGPCYRLGMVKLQRPLFGHTWAQSLWLPLGHGKVATLIEADPIQKAFFSYRLGMVKLQQTTVDYVVNDPTSYRLGMVKLQHTASTKISQTARVTAWAW